MFSSTVCNQGTIMISGDFDGLSLSMARWMVEEKGAKNIILLSRRTVAELQHTDKPLYEEWVRLQQICVLLNRKAQVDVVQLDVTCFDDVHELIGRLGQTNSPVRGIVYSDVVAQNKLLANLSHKASKLAINAKVQGAWNLHYATLRARASLHFFVMFSSIQNHLIDLGFAGYNAGNEFLDSLARYRSQSLNQPALSVSLPAVSDSEIFHREQAMLTPSSSMSGLETVPTIIIFKLVEQLFNNQHQSPCPILLACKYEVIGASTNKNRLATYQLIQFVEQQQTKYLHACDSRATHQDSPTSITQDKIVDRTREIVARLLQTSNIERIETDRSLLAYGMDSLVAISLYNVLSQQFKVLVPLADILRGISVQLIAKRVYEQLCEQQQSTVIMESNITTTMVSDNNIEQSSMIVTDSYTGMNNVIRIIRSETNKKTDRYIAFCIGDVDTSFDSTLLQQQPSSSVYVLRVPNGSSAVIETISQMRRIQPHGPYTLMTTNKQGEQIARQMIKQLEQHHQAGFTSLLIVNKSSFLDSTK